VENLVRENVKRKNPNPNRDSQEAPINIDSEGGLKKALKV